MRSQSGRDKPPVPRQGDPRRSPQAPRTPSTRPGHDHRCRGVDVVGNGHDVKHLPGLHGNASRPFGMDVGRLAAPSPKAASDLVGWARFELATSASRTSPRTRYQATYALHGTTWRPLPPMLRPARERNVGNPVCPAPTGRRGREASQLPSAHPPMTIGFPLAASTQRDGSPADSAAVPGPTPGDRDTVQPPGLKSTEGRSRYVRCAARL